MCCDGYLANGRGCWLVGQWDSGTVEDYQSLIRSLNSILTSLDMHHGRAPIVSNQFTHNARGLVNSERKLIIYSTSACDAQLLLGL